MSVMLHHSTNLVVGKTNMDTFHGVTQHIAQTINVSEPAVNMTTAVTMAATVTAILGRRGGE